MSFEYKTWYADLPPEVANKICTCLEKTGWSRDPKTEYWVCAKCRKPSRYSALAECAECEKLFFPVEWLDPKYEAICPSCE